MAGVGGWKVEITGLRQIYDALAETDKRAAKIVTQGITDAGKNVATAASYIAPGRNPVSNWGTWFYSRDGRDLGFDPGTVASSFKLRRNNYRRRGVSAGIGWDVYQTNPGGAIWEVMGDGSRVTTPAGEHLVGMINSRFKAGPKPRSLFPAYYSVMSQELRDKMRDTIVEEARKAGLT